MPHSGKPADGEVSGRLTRRLAMLSALSFVAILAWFFWISFRDPKIAMLMPSNHGEWITFPKPPDTTPHKAVDLTAFFRYRFSATDQSIPASITFRAFRRATVLVNNHPVPLQRTADQNWKLDKTADISQFIVPGTNWILVAVTNNYGPPALVAELTVGNGRFYTDTNWQASLAGSSWENVELASGTPAIRPGNPLYGRENLIGSLAKTWPVTLVILTCIALFFLATPHIPPLRQSMMAWRQNPVFIAFVALVPVAILLLNNIPQIAPLFGFDRDGHLEYIDYILQNSALPLADEGWQMYQPPLFYVFCAILIKPFASSTSSYGIIVFLRFVSALFALLEVALIFLSLREIFPGQRWKQLVGTLFAALVPANLYLAHHITNEGLAALFVTASLYAALRAMNPSALAIGWRVFAGIFIGLALLTKFSAIIALPVIAVAIAWSRCDCGNVSAALKSVAIFFGVTLLVCGWHYARVWHHFGRPLVGNWDPNLPFAWWQDPGFHTPTWFLRAGSVFSTPIFSAIRSFGDGFFSTLWADGLCSGSARMDFRPAWNYNLMNVACLVAVPLMALLLMGAISSLLRFCRAPSPQGFLLLSLPLLFFIAFIYMAITVPSYAQLKAFYMLPGSLCVSVFLVEGWQVAAKYGSKRSP